MSIAMSPTEDEPEIMLEACVDSVESAKAYVAFSRSASITVSLD
jgi:hypothetical protein